MARLMLLLVAAPSVLASGAQPAGLGGQQPQAARPPIPSVVEDIVTEPVFQGRAYVYEAGRANPYTIVLVHGLGEGASRDWAHVVPVLAQQYHVLTFDLPGFGRSDKQNALYSPANYAAFVKWIIEERVNGPFTLVGHSMGGVVALRFAATYPRNLRHLILIDAPGILHRSVAFETAGRMAAGSRLDGLWSGALDAMDSVWGTVLSRMESRFFTPDADVILASRNLREQVLKGQPDLIAGLALAQEDFSRSLQFVTTPVTLLWGTADLLAPIRTAKALVAQLPDARLIELEGIGHSPMTERPDRFDAVLLQNIMARPAGRAAPPKAAPSERVGRFVDESGRSVSGAYRLLEIENCDDFRLDGVTARSVRIKNSTVRIENSRIEGGLTALAAEDSTVRMTGGLLDGEVAIVGDRSELDLAGVTIRGKKAIITTADWAKLVLSISKAHLGSQAWCLHGIEELSPETLPWPKPAR
jgi:pimeloyl-ACP methyl ester carboxylesterase